MKRLYFALLSAVVLLAACAPAAASTAAPSADFAVGQRASTGYANSQEMAVPPLPAPTAGPALAPDKGAVAGSGVPADAQERLVIQNANLSMVVKDPRAKMDAIEAMAKAMGGYLVSSNLYDTYSPSGEKLPEATIVIRVPAEKLDEALKQIKSDALEPPTENRTGQDVTQQYVDLQSRLRNLESAERQLNEIMNNATKTQDVLDVFNQLTAIREQIELVKGQMQYYEQSAAFSEISAQLVAQQTLEPIKIGSWTPKGALSRALQSLVNFGQSLVDFLITFVIYWLPVLIVIAIPFLIVYFIVRAIVRRSRKNPPAQPQG